MCIEFAGWLAACLPACMSVCLSRSLSLSPCENGTTTFVCIEGKSCILFTYTEICIPLDVPPHNK